MRRPLIKGKDLLIFDWTRKISSRKVHGKFAEKSFFYLIFFRREGK
jgi:hypothetical protein